LFSKFTPILPLFLCICYSIFEHTLHHVSFYIFLFPLFGMLIWCVPLSHQIVYRVCIWKPFLYVIFLSYDTGLQCLILCRYYYYYYYYCCCCCCCCCCFCWYNDVIVFTYISRLSTSSRTYIPEYTTLYLLDTVTFIFRNSRTK
jgi:hypothetical protein